MFFFRYHVYPTWAKVTMITIAAIFNIIVAFGVVAMGLHLFIHIVVSWVWGSLFIVILIKFDTPYHDFVTKTAFILKKTKRKVFVVFFICMALFVLSIIILNCVEALTDPNISWIIQIKVISITYRLIVK